MEQPIFKTEVNEINQIKQCLNNFQKLNGRMVILGEQNKERIYKAVELLKQVEKILNEIK